MVANPLADDKEGVAGSSTMLGVARARLSLPHDGASSYPSLDAINPVS